MIKTIILLFGICIATHAIAEDGIYLTPADFKNGKIFKVDSGTLEFYGKAYFKLNGVKKVLKVNEVFAARVHGVLMRFSDGHLYDAAGGSKYCFWHFRTNGDHGAYYDGYGISLGIDGAIYQVHQLNSLKKLADKHPEFGPLYNCAAGVMASQPKGSSGGLQQFIYNCLGTTM